MHISLRKLLISLELKYPFQWNGNIYLFGMEIQGVLAAGTRVEGLQVTSRSAGPPFYKMSHTELFISHKICLFFENILPSLKLQIKIPYTMSMPIRLSFVFLTEARKGIMFCICLTYMDEIRKIYH